MDPTPEQMAAATAAGVAAVTAAENDIAAIGVAAGAEAAGVEAGAVAAGDAAVSAATDAIAAAGVEAGAAATDATIAVGVVAHDGVFASRVTTATLDDS